MCPEGASVDPAKGRSPGLGIDHLVLDRANGPTVHPEENRLARWAETRFLLQPRNQGCALRWINGWAFGPNMSACDVEKP
jgi:hypothetical protein